jgi:RNA polymerase sigma-70 factor (ECF subfamily)
MSVAGDQRIIQKLVEEHYQALYRYAYRLSGSADLAADLTQETFCKAHLQLRQLREMTRAKAWLFSILRNNYLHGLRSDKSHKLVSLDGIDPPTEAPDPVPEFDPAQLQTALNELPEDFRTPLILFYFEEFSYREIAEQMDLPIGTVMSRLARAKAHLRDRLSPALAAPISKGRGVDGL